MDGSRTIDMREFCHYFGEQQFTDDAEVADVDRAYQEAASWFGKNSPDLVGIAQQKDANLNFP